MQSCELEHRRLLDPKVWPDIGEYIARVDLLGQ